MKIQGKSKNLIKIVYVIQIFIHWRSFQVELLSMNRHRKADYYQFVLKKGSFWVEIDVIPFLINKFCYLSQKGYS